MIIKQLAREELMSEAFAHTGEHPVHLTGPAKGKQLGKRRVSKIISRFINELKANGMLIEIRPFVAPSDTRRHARFIRVPYTPDMFAPNDQPVFGRSTINQGSINKAGKPVLHASERN